MSRQLDFFKDNEKEIIDSFTLHVERKLLTRVREIAKQRRMTIRAFFQEALRNSVEQYDTSRNDNRSEADI